MVPRLFRGERWVFHGGTRNHDAMVKTLRGNAAYIGQ